MSLQISGYLKKILLIPVLFLILQARAQPDWKQSLRYAFHVKFNPGEKSLDALMKLQYCNHSPDTISFIWFHVWPNAYRNDRTLYSEQILENGDTRFYFSGQEQKGYLNRLDFRVDGVLANFQDHPEYIDVVKLILPKPLSPNDSITIMSSFHVRLPYNFNGNGYTAKHFELKNWYPEPAVYDSHGWHPMPFLVQGGAYHEAADFQVVIEAPSSYQIAAGGKADTIAKSGNINKYQFTLKNANAFAWIADTRFILKTDSLETSGGQKISLQYFYIPSKINDYKILMDETKKEIGKLSDWLTPYPHPTISIVQASALPDENFSGLISIGSANKMTDWRLALRKGLTGQWFQTILLTDQRNQPWLSKGFMHFYSQRLIGSPENSAPGSASDMDLWLRVAEKNKTTQPVSTAAPVFSTANDSLMPGNKAGVWLRLLQDSVGEMTFDKNMHEYFSKWKFKHPYPDNLKTVMDTPSQKNLQPLFDKLSTTGSLFSFPEKRTIKPTFMFSASNTAKYNYIGIGPLPGYNRYDGFMLGVLVHNINLPANNFEFLFTPMYAFGSKTVEGLGRISYSWFPAKHFHKMTVGINGGRFDTNKATDSTGNFLFENFTKLVPYIRVDFNPSSPRSTIRKWMDLKTYLITEKNFGNFDISSTDSLIHPNSVTSSFRYVNQLSFNLEDNRVLYPYNLRAEFQQSEKFYRINLSANYFMNYPDGGGLQVRFFAAKFGAWNNSKATDLARYEPKLLGVNGDEDYLYEDYFAGRSANNATIKSSISNSGIYAQQIMNRDGGLKLRIDDLDFLQGRSENWISSLNFNTTLPAKLFPFLLPIRLFFDFGTYAEGWQSNSLTSRFLYTGGIQLSLFKNVLNIYAPLFYSSDFDQAFGSTSFGQKITFSIDIQNIPYKKMIRKIAEHE